MPDLCPKTYTEVYDQRYCRSFCLGTGCKYLRECRTYKSLPDIAFKPFDGDI